MTEEHTKTEEVKKILKALESDDFEKACENEGFTVCRDSEESVKSKKKANL